MADQLTTTDAALPALDPDADLSKLMNARQSPALMVLLNDKLFDRCRLIAKYMAEARGFLPPNLVGNQSACFAVVMRSMTWKMDPYAIAQNIYQTPAGTVGYYGKLCQAVLQNSGQLSGAVRFEHYGRVKVKDHNGQIRQFKSIEPIVELIRNGDDQYKNWIIVDEKDWSAVMGKFEVRRGQEKEGKAGKEYAHRTWGRPDAEGLGVRVSAQVRGEAERRTMDFDLIQAYPLNSTLWASDPKTQIIYTSCRRFADSCAPDLFMGVPFDNEEEGWQNMRDVTPAEAKAPAAPPRPSQATQAARPATIDVPVEQEQDQTDNSESSGAQQAPQEDERDEAVGDGDGAQNDPDLILWDAWGDKLNDVRLTDMTEWAIAFSNLVTNTATRGDLNNLVANNGEVMKILSQEVTADCYATINTRNQEFDQADERRKTAQIRDKQQGGKGVGQQGKLT